jgi:UDP-3-O-[3-hydroxymyristoyl] glucosamine N-acyltransferase
MAPCGISYSLAELAAKTAASLVGPPDYRISGVNTLEEADPEDASFLANPRYRDAMKQSAAGVICIDTHTPLVEGKNYLVTDHPSRAFQTIVELLLASSSSGFVGIHPTAVIHESAQIGPRVTIGPYAVIDRNVRIGEDTYIGPHVSIGYDVEIGSHCTLHPSAVVREKCRLGHRVILQPGAIIGSCGFGYTLDASGRYQKLEQLGIVILEDDVEIGANTTIDRSRFKATIIRQGSKIDNLCQIAHNVEIGHHNAIAAQTGIAGSAKTGKYVMLGGQVGIVGHVVLDDQVMIATRGGVSKSLKAGKYRGSPAIPINEYHRQEVYVRKLDEFAKRLKELEKKLN